MEIVAHRGNSPGFEELTPAAFAHTLGLPIHGVECDVRLSGDHEVMVHHDPTVDRTSDAVGPVNRKTLAELKDINIGTEVLPQQMLTLSELLEMVMDANDKHLYLEIKTPALNNQLLEERVAQSLRSAGLLADPRIHIISFAHLAIRRMARLAPELDRFYLRREWQAKRIPRDFLLSRPTGLGLSVASARARRALVGSLGLPTYMWTANEPDDILFARDIGIDILATDVPELAMDTLASR